MAQQRGGHHQRHAGLRIPGNCAFNLRDEHLFRSQYCDYDTVHDEAPLVAMIGNLVIRDETNDSMVLWQSFDYPSDTILPGGGLGFNKIIGKNISLISPSSLYSLELDTRSRGFIIRDIPSGSMLSGNFPSWMKIREDGTDFVMFYDAQTYLHLDDGGRIVLYNLGDCYSPLWFYPENPFGYCGPYGLYSSYSRSCGCPIGFDAHNTETNRFLGCSRLVPIICAESMFYVIDGIDSFPDRPQFLMAKSTEECEAVCSSYCSCMAYAYDVTCLLWYGELWNTTMLGSDSVGRHIYIRVSQQETSLKNSKHVNIVVLVAGILSLIISVALSFLWIFLAKLFATRPLDARSGLMVFSYAQVKNATKNFSEKLGEGGFGSVFKGTLPGCSVMAVKKLKCVFRVEKQFRSEVQTIGMIQHTNLVRLLGFCVTERNRLLVYEYMPNGSLSSHLFSDNSETLCWQLRYCVALGTARGLAYLHEECMDCIVHCDMKPDNVLLDTDFCPKIADFGMAKLLNRDFSRALTTMRGTIGYLAPEWISGLPITHKADVYSYGLMLLEIISGRRNSEKIKEGRHTYFPIYAACKVNEGDVMCLLDSRLEGNADAEQLERACRIACWCIQDYEDQRPMMGQVVLMLEGVMDVLVPPIPMSLQNFLLRGHQERRHQDYYEVLRGDSDAQPILRDVAVSHLRHVNHVPEETSRRILASDRALIATESSPRPSTTNDNYYLDGYGDGFDDIWDERSDLFHALLPEEELVIVESEFADEEEGSPEEILAFCRAKRRLERLEPAQLNAEAGVDRERAGARRRIAGVEDAGVEGGGGANGEVCAAAEAPVVSQEWRQERHPQAFGCKQASKQRKSKSTMITTKLTIATSMNRRRGKMIGPTKSTTRRPSQLRPVGWPKKVEPYGGRVTGSKTEYQPKTTGLLPVSAKESPKLKMAS
ncbi:hypothetical protein OsJ_00927 [Oryza sativa Japonica Group]|uniref:non-specific serine/threonine protein kinase n=1 Tax=Oryza sativa subsp. japonica TaxID=39947 RepID=B9EU56_ORYSJ|nr:hypothetical protein OsJ_00927 [Oryza sativa Japonica Group]